jgi:two-component system cell cycle sensor histidine kinase/response regulator CckA
VLLVSAAFGATIWRYENAQDLGRDALAARADRLRDHQAAAVFWQQREAMNEYVITGAPEALTRIGNLRAEFARIAGGRAYDPGEAPVVAEARSAYIRLLIELQRLSNAAQQQRGGAQASAIEALRPYEEAVLAPLRKLQSSDLVKERGRSKAAAKAADQAKLVGILGALLSLAAGLGFAVYVSGLLRHVTRQAGVLEQTLDEREQAHAALQDRELQLWQAQKMEAVGRLAGGVAHDFNNLLLSVTIATELATRAEDDLELQELLGEISGAADRGASLTQQLLTFSRRQVVEPRVLELAASVDALAPMLSRVLGEDVVVQSDLAADLWKVKADPTQIDQVLVNLCVNARDAMPNGGVVAVAARNVVLSALEAEPLGIAAGDYATVSVTDTGQGMDADTAARIFDPFFTTKEQGKGTGLGLSTVYGIAIQNSGAIGLETAPGQGTTFTLYLPRTQDELPQTAEKGSPGDESPPADVEAQTILLVEDERSVRTLVRRLLEGEGYIVVTADSAEDALVVADREPGIDLVLTDMVMPGMNGRQLIDQLERSRPGMKVVYMSGYFDERATTTVDAPFLQKPYTHQALARTVRDALAS